PKLRISFEPMNAESQARLYSREPSGPKLEVLGPKLERSEEVLTPLALQLLASLHRRFNPRRLELLAARAKRQAEFDDGALPDFLRATEAVRAGNWRVSPVPKDLEDRRVEITGPVDRTMIIETLPAAFEMDEILYELREHSAGLNCGRWDYIFSFIKKFRNRREFLLPDRATVTMERHFLKSYVELLIKTCHRRGAHAIGGMAAQIPIRDDPAANEAAMARVRADKLREARAGHDGTWIAHPGLAGIAREAFDAVM